MARSHCAVSGGEDAGEAIIMSRKQAVASAEFTKFDNAMRTILQVSKTDLNQMLAEEKIANAGKPKRGPKPKAKIENK